MYFFLFLQFYFSLRCFFYFETSFRLFFILLFYMALSLVLDFKLKIKSNWKNKIISTPVPLENLLFNHFHSRLNITVIFPGYIRVSSYPVFLLISHSRASIDEPNKKESMIIIRASNTTDQNWCNALNFENIEPSSKMLCNTKLWTVVKDVLDVSTIITKVFFFRSIELLAPDASSKMPYFAIYNKVARIKERTTKQNKIKSK